MSHYLPHTLNRLIFDASIRFLQLAKPQAQQLALKAGISKENIQGVTITTLKNMLTRRYVLGAIVAVWKQFPAEVTRYMGMFFDLDLRRTERIHKQLLARRANFECTLGCVEYWFQRYGETFERNSQLGDSLSQEMLSTQTALLHKYRNQRELTRLSCESDVVAEDYMEILKEEAQLHQTWRADRRLQYAMNKEVHRQTRDENLFVQLVEEMNALFARRAVEDDLLINEKIAMLIMDAMHFIPEVRSQMARKRERDLQAQRERQQEWLAAKAQEKKAAAAAERQKKEDSRLAQRALDRKRVEKKEVKW